MDKILHKTIYMCVIDRRYGQAERMEIRTGRQIDNVDETRDERIGRERRKEGGRDIAN